MFASQLPDGLDQSHGSARGALGVVLMRAGIAEIDCSTIADPSRNVPLNAQNRSGDGVLKCADQIGHVLRIEMRGQRAQSHEVAEHDRHMTALGAIARRGAGRRGGRHLACELSDRPQDPQPVSERHTQVPEVLIGQLRQHIGFDPVFPKYGFVLVQAEVTQPSPDVHLSSSPHELRSDVEPEERLCPAFETDY